MTKIKEALIDFNPWWKEEFKAEFKERDIYKEVLKFIELPQIIAFTGLRRVGKTTIMFKCVEDFIANGFDARNIVYFSFDEFEESEIRGVLAEYEKIMERPLQNGKYLLLFDEVQKLKNWENQIKAVYDVFKGKIKMIISGSESLFIKKKSKETLGGRIFEFRVDPLSFREFLVFKGMKTEPTGLYEGELIRSFDEFMLMQGFPEMVGIKEKPIIKKYIEESIIEKVIYKDIPKLFKIKDIAIIKSLLNIITEEPGQLIELSDLASELKISRQTVSNYLSYLEDSFLIKRLYNFSKNRRKMERKLKKYYPAVLSVDLIFKEDDFSRSKVFECVLVNQLKAEFFWRDPYKNEVDIVMPDKNPLPIEIKYGKIDFKGMLAFMKKFKSDSGYIISKETEEQKKLEQGTVSVVPAFKFLLKR